MRNLTPQNEQDILALVKTHMDDTVGLENLNVCMTHGQSIKVRLTRKLPTRETWKNGRISFDVYKRESIQEWRYDVDELIDKLDQELGIDFESNGINPSGFTLITVE